MHEAKRRVPAVPEVEVVEKREAGEIAVKRVLRCGRGDGEKCEKCKGAEHRSGGDEGRER